MPENRLWPVSIKGVLFIDNPGRSVRDDLRLRPKRVKPFVDRREICCDLANPCSHGYPNRAQAGLPSPVRGSTGSLPSPATLKAGQLLITWRYRPGFASRIFAASEHGKNSQVNGAFHTVEFGEVLPAETRLTLFL